MPPKERWNEINNARLQATRQVVRKASLPALILDRALHGPVIANSVAEFVLNNDTVGMFLLKLVLELSELNQRTRDYAEQLLRNTAPTYIVQKEDS